MNIIEKNKLVILSTLIFLFTTGSIWAGEQNAAVADSTFALSVEAGSGFTSNLNPGKNKAAQDVFSPFAKIYWKPNHLLNLGIETAFIYIRSESRKKVSNEFGETDFEAVLTGVPILLTYRMNLPRNFTFTGGVGIAYVNSTVDAFDTEVSINYWYYCFYFSLGYTYPITDKFGIGAEILTYSLPRIEQDLFGINLKISYDFFKW